MSPLNSAPPRYYVRAANGSTIDLVSREAEARKIAKENKANVYVLRAGRLVKIG